MAATDDRRINARRVGINRGNKVRKAPTATAAPEYKATSPEVSHAVWLPDTVSCVSEPALLHCSFFRTPVLTLGCFFSSQEWERTRGVFDGLVQILQAEHGAGAFLEALKIAFGNRSHPDGVAWHPAFVHNVGVRDSTPLPLPTLAHLADASLS